ncbi:MAG: prolyl aminopeptidase [Pseudomonadota bacterium]
MPYPSLTPFAQGTLDLGNGHRMAWERCGAENGIPLLILHGGPGGSVQPYYRQLFDPRQFHGILFDQRGCGRSTPTGVLEDNTTSHLISDIEQLRKALGIDRWCVLGGSWGSTLALSYAQAHPEAVSGLVVSGIFLARECDRDWFWYGAHVVYPDAWHRFKHFLPAREQTELRDSYLRRVLSDDKRISEPAAVSIMQYEAHLLHPEPDQAFISSVVADQDATLTMARLFCHFDYHHSFLRENQLIDNAHRLKGIPSVIINGRHDMCTPCGGASALAEHWQDARLEIVEKAGHRWCDPKLAPAISRALDEVATQKCDGATQPR